MATEHPFSCRDFGHLRPYSEMKDSGVECLGRVPAHWHVATLGQIGRFFKGNGGTKADEVREGVPCVRYGDLYTRHDFHIASSRAFVDPAVAATTYTPIKFGDVLFAGSGETIDEIGKSAVNLIDDQSFCGGDVIVFRTRVEMDAQFLGYATDSRPSARQKAQMGRGFTVIHIYANDLKYLAMAIPPLPEQIAIASFLEHTSSRIDRYIQAKEKLIRLLEEQKRTIVYEAVTGRIDVRTGRPYASFKPSGVTWLGELPEHWWTRRLCTLASITTGDRDTINRQDDGQYPFFVRSQIVERIDTWSFDGEAVLTAGDGVGVGRVFHYVDGKFDYHQRVYKFSDFRGILGRFFFEFLRAMLRYEVMRGTAKSTVDSLRLPMLRNFAFAVPTLQEQSRIVHHVDRETGRIDHALNRIREQIRLFREYRTRLIADVVTGKLDVRSIVAEPPNVESVGIDQGTHEDGAKSNSHNTGHGTDGVNP